jgi:tetratricopeptide (TPR) repeat protein
LLTKKEKFDEALIILKKASQTSSYYGIWLMIGRIYSEQKEYNEAENAYRMSHYLVPGLLRPRFELVKLYCKIGKDEAAIKIAKETLKIGAKTNTPLAQKILNNMKLIVKNNEPN